MFSYMLLLFYYILEYHKSNSNEVKLECSGYVNLNGCTKASLILKANSKIKQIKIHCFDTDFLIYDNFQNIPNSFYSHKIVKITQNGIEFCNIDITFDNCYIKITQTDKVNIDYESISDKFNVVLYGIDHKCDNSINKDHNYLLLEVVDDLEITTNKFDVKLKSIQSYESIYLCLPHICNPMKSENSTYVYLLDSNKLTVDFIKNEVVIDRKIKGIFGGFKIILQSKISQKGDILYDIFEITYKYLQLKVRIDQNHINVNSFELKAQKPSFCEIFLKRNNEPLEYKSFVIEENKDLNFTYLISAGKYLIYYAYAKFQTNNFEDLYLINVQGIFNFTQTEHDSNSSISNDVTSPQDKNNKNSSSKSTIIIITVVVIIILIVLSVLAYLLYRRKIQNA